MAKIIAIVGSKGGTGKTSTAHLIAHGAGSLPRPIMAMVVTTDPEEALRTDQRRYGIVDGRTPQKLVEELERLMPIERLLIVIDGAAARRDIDKVVASAADLVLLPYGPSQQDAERAVDDMARLPMALGLPNRWPKHPGTAKRAKRWLNMVPEKRRLPVFPVIPKLDGLLAPDGYRDAAYELATPARGLLLEALFRAGIDPDDIAIPKVAA